MTVSDRAIPCAGVIGYPIQHSLSPLIMQTWLNWHSLAGSYDPIEIKPEDFKHWLDGFRSSTQIGVNVTLPHKQTIAALDAHHPEAVSVLGAANILYKKNNEDLYTDNTDIIGIETALERQGLTESKGSVCLIGAGGAARAALWVLKDQGWGDIRLANRTPVNAIKLAENLDVKASVYSLDEMDTALDGCQLVINASSLGMGHSASLRPGLGGLKRNAVVFDMVYAPLETDLLRCARQSGFRTIDGLEMLIGQARPSFEILFGKIAPSENECPLRPMLEDVLASRT